MSGKRVDFRRGSQAKAVIFRHGSSILTIPPLNCSRTCETEILRDLSQMTFACTDTDVTAQMTFDIKL